MRTLILIAAFWSMTASADLYFGALSFKRNLSLGAENLPQQESAFLSFLREQVQKDVNHFSSSDDPKILSHTEWKWMAHDGATLAHLGETGDFQSLLHAVAESKPEAIRVTLIGRTNFLSDGPMQTSAFRAEKIYLQLRELSDEYLDLSGEISFLSDPTGANGVRIDPKLIHEIETVRNEYPHEVATLVFKGTHREMGVEWETSFDFENLNRFLKFISLRSSENHCMSLLLKSTAD